MIRRVLVLATALGLFAGISGAAAQEREIQGSVLAIETDAPLSGANVVVVGTTTGTLTGPNGEFTLSVPAGDVELRVSLIGYQSEDVVVPAGQSTVTVSLAQDVLDLEGVVVTGQATSVARRNLANAVSTVTAEQLDRAPAQTVETALQGKVAGANISANSGAPGGGMQVNLRGVASINAASQPLYVIDGVVVSNEAIASGANALTNAAGNANASNQDNPVNRIADLNPNDIASVEVLKGASAAAIYGSQASNGVILITTKSGTAGVPRYRVSQEFGMYQLSNTIGSRTFETLDEALATYAGFAGATAADTARISQSYGDGTAFDHEEQLAGRTDLSTRTSFSISGGDETTRYYASGLLLDDAGIIQNTGYEKQSIRLNLDQRVGPRINLGLNTNLIHSVARRGLTNNDNTGTSYYVTFAGTPTFVDLTPSEEGIYPNNPRERSNPLQTAALLTSDEDVWRFIAAMNADAELFETGTQSLVFRAAGGADYFTQENELFSPPVLQFEPQDGLPGTSILANSDNLNVNGSANLVHTFAPVGGALTATTSAGVQYQDSDLNIARITGRNIVGGQRNVDAATVQSIVENRARTRDLGVYIQEEMLLLDERLLLTAGVRADRSSSNGDPDQFFYYPKAATSYRFPNLGTYVDELKLRVAYGETGNQPLFGQKFTPLSATNNIGGLPGLVVVGLAGDPDIEPERMREIEGGFDAVLFGGNAELNFTFYQQNITNLLLQRALAPSTGFVTQFFNGGELETRGIEVALDATPIRTDDFSWVTRTTFYTTESTIVELPVPAFETGGFGTALGAFRIQEGRSATQIVGNTVENDEVVVRQIGDATPDFNMAFINDLTFGRFNLSSLFDWQQGGDIINLTKLLYDLNQNSADYELPAGVGSVRPIPECSPNCSGRERLAGFGRYTQQYIEDGSFLKLRELSLSYNLPPELLASVWSGAESVQIRLSGRDLITITDYSGLTPEVSNFGSQPIARNIDVGPFPPSRSFWLGIDIGF